MQWASSYGSRDLQRAQLEFLKAMELDPRLSVAAANLGQTYFELRQYAEAERAFARAISVRPEAAVPYNGLAQVVLAQGRPREAVRAALMAISRYELQDDYLGSFYVNLAAALQQWGRAQAALEAVARAKRLGVSTGDATIRTIEKAAASQKR
jgi:tetratricopeptide (TPR) repeat protein